MTEAQNFWRFRAPLNETPIPSSRAAKISGRPIDINDLQQMLDRLVYVSPLRGYPLRVAVINDPKVNARTDGLMIFVNSGLLTVFQQHEDLIASVLAHELGHILANHQPEGKPRTSSWSYLSYLTPALSVLPYGGLYSGLAGTAVREGVQMRNYSYDRLQENEADVIGVYLALEAGYDALGLSQFLDHVGGSGFSAPQTLSIPTSVSGIPQSVAVTLLSSSPLYRTHPPSSKRKKIVQLVLQRRKGLLSQEQLEQEASWAGKLYKALESSVPKTAA